MREYKVVLSAGVTLFYDALDIMKEKWDWSVIYAIEEDIGSIQVDKLKKTFPGVLIHDRVDAIRGLSYDNILSPPYKPLDKPILDDLIVGDYRNTQMRVISGRFGKE